MTDVSGQLTDIQNRRTTISAEIEELKEARGNKDLKYDPVKRKWIPAKTARELQLDRELNRLNEREKFTKQQEKSKLESQERREEQKEKRQKAKVLAQQIRRAPEKTINEAERKGELIEEYRELKGISGEVKTAELERRDFSKPSEIKDQDWEKQKKEYAEARKKEFEQEFFRKQKELKQPIKETEYKVEKPKGTLKVYEKPKGVKGLTFAAEKLEYSAQQEKNPLKRQLKSFGAVGLSIPVGAVNLIKSVPKTIGGVFKFTTSPVQEKIATTIVLKESLKAAPAQFKRNIDANPAVFVGETVGAIAISGGITKGISKILSKTTKVQAVGYKSQTERIANTDKIIDATKIKAQLIAKNPLKKVSGKVEGMTLETYKPTTNKKFLLSKGEQRIILKTPLKETKIRGTSVGIVRPEKKVTTSARLTKLNIKTGTKTTKQDIVQLSKQRVIKSSPIVKTKDVSELLISDKKKPIIESKTQSISAGITKQTRKQTITTPTGKEAEASIYQSAGLGTYNVKGINIIKTQFKNMVDKLSRTTSGMSSGRLKSKTLTKLKTTVPKSDIIDVSKEILKKEAITPIVQKVSYTKSVSPITTIKKTQLPKTTKPPNRTIRITQKQTPITRTTPPNRTIRITQKQTPITRTTPVTKIKQTPITRTTPISKTTIKSKTSITPITKTTVLTKTKPIQKEKVIPKTIPKPISRTIQKTTPFYSNYLTPSTITASPTTPIFTPIIFLNKKQESIFKIPKEKKKKKGKFRPTVFSVATQFKGKENIGGALSGLGIRPLKM